MNKIKFYIKKRQIKEDKTIISKSHNYLRKARYNLQTLDILDKLNFNKSARESLDIPKRYESYEWMVICGYYAMYSAALALIAKAGFRSKNHVATIAILEEYYVKKRLLDRKLFLLLKNVYFQKQELEKLSDAKDKREIAQYSITKQTTKRIAEKIKKNAYSFVNSCEEVLENI